MSRRLFELDTPALVVDLDIMEHNMDHMMRFLLKGTVGIRPHAKSHKTPEIAKMQLERGAVGITCAKLGEAEALVGAGIPDVLIANQVVGKEKLRRLAELALKAKLRVAVDSPQNVKELSEAAVTAGSTVGVLVEVDIGLGRCGVREPSQAVELARMAVELPGVRYDGIMGYEGHCVFIESFEERESKAREAYTKLESFVWSLSREGLKPQIVSSAGTGTYMFAGRNPLITDIQAGSYIFMDMRYGSIQGVDFQQSLAVLSTVVSAPEPGLFVCDAGLKSMTAEFGPVGVLPSSGLTVVGMSEEHVKLRQSENRSSEVKPFLKMLDDKYGSSCGSNLKPGDKVLLIPSHCCTTVNLHDKIYPVREGMLVDTWRISARGRFD